MDKAGEIYWENIWKDKVVIDKINVDYYTNKLLHELYVRYFTYDEKRTNCEIGCAMSQNLLYFNDYYGYKIHGIDYEEKSALKTKEIYEEMGYSADILFKDFFIKDNDKKYDLLSSFGVFEHFEDLNASIKQTKRYLKKNGMILTVIPNMNGITGLLQKILNKDVYDVHIPYTKDNILSAHKANGYETLFCDYYGLYQGGVININGIKAENTIRKLLSIPGKPFYYFNKLLKIRLDSKLNSPYIIYIGKKI